MKTIKDIQKEATTPLYFPTDKTKTISIVEVNDLRESALEDLHNRLKKVADKLEEVRIIDGKFQWKGKEADLSLNDYGRICEIGYIVSKFNFDHDDLLPEEVKASASP